MLTGGLIPHKQVMEYSCVEQQLQQEEFPFSCYVDGSRAQDGKAGIGVYLLYRGKAVYWSSKAVSTVNPAQVEAKALLEGYSVLVKKAGGVGAVFSDSKDLVAAMAQQAPIISDWRTFEEVWKAWIVQKEYQLHTRYISRDHYNLTIAHK